ncbi:YfjL-like protein [Sutcliffiella cohnii]
MNRKKVMYWILLVLLVSIILFLYNAFNGNPISKHISKRVLENHLLTTYPDKEFRVKDGMYDFKFNEYIFPVVQIGSGEQYDFQVRGFLQPEVTGDGVRFASLDIPLMERLSKEAAEEIYLLLKDEIESVRAVDVQLEVLQGSEEVKWHKDFPLEKPIYIHIVIDATNFGKEEMLNDTEIIQKILAREQYNYDSVTVNGNIIDDPEITKDLENGYVKYSVSFEQETKLKLKDVKELE